MIYDDNELEEVEKEDKMLVIIKWLIGCLYIDINGVFGEELGDKKVKLFESIFMFFFSVSGVFYVSFFFGWVMCIILILCRYIVFLICVS